MVLVNGNEDIPVVDNPLQGATVSSLHMIEDSGFFIFKDLSINTPGQFQLKFMLYRRLDDEAICLQETISFPFRARKHRHVNSRAPGRKRKSNSPKHRLQTQVSDSDRESLWENSDGDYSFACTKVDRPRYKRRNVSGILRRDSSEEELYNVEQILDWAWNNDKQQMEYRIKWEGFDSAENTWEPLIHLIQCQEQLAHFHRQREWTCLHGNN